MKKIIVLLMAIIAIISTQSIYAISGSINGPESVYKAKDSIVTIDDIIDLYSSNNGAILIAEDTFTGNGNRLGSYYIELYLSNNAEIKKSINVYVVEDLGEATLVVNQNQIYIANDKKLTPQEIITILTYTGFVSYNSTAAVTIITDTYSKNEVNNGNYIFDFRIVTSSGTNKIYESIIRVHKPNNLLTGDFIITAPPTLTDQLSSLILTIVIPGAIIVCVAYFGYKVYKRNSKKFRRNW